MDWALLQISALSYLAGGIPSGYLIARQLKGIDIREHGSGNPGAANVYRVVGTGAGIATLVVDALKGFVPVLLADRLYPDRLWVPILCGSLAILGHVWTIFLRFRGGKAVATSGGVFLALAPKPLILSLAVFAAGAGASRHISVGSMTAALAFPIFAVLFKTPKPVTAMAVAVSALILVRHIPNLRRLLAGGELGVPPVDQPREGLEKTGEKH